MSVFLTHVTMGLCLGLVGVFLVQRERAMSRTVVVSVLVWGMILAAAPDLDRLGFEHRSTFTNATLALLVPGLVAGVLAPLRGGAHPFWRATLPMLPGLLGSHLVLDLWGWTGDRARVWWPWDRTVYTPPSSADTHAFGGMAGVDAGMPIVLFLLWSIVYAWAHLGLSGWLRRQTRWPFGVAYAGFVVGSGLFAVLPMVLYSLWGWYVPLSYSNAPI